MDPKKLEAYHNTIPQLKEICNYRETVWFNPRADIGSTPDQRHGQLLTSIDIEDAGQRMERFRPLLSELFPELQISAGLISSPLKQFRHPEEFFPDTFCQGSGQARFFMKCDSHLPVSGSIKARGGFYAILKHAEDIGISEGLITENAQYTVLAAERARNIFANHAISVGSTGNLGLSIGIMGARIGFKVYVHMSSDARDWKKRLLRSHGVQVIEHDGDYGTAVRAGREQAAGDNRCFFIDDENSVDLFLGYSCAAKELETQLQENGVRIDAAHPLVVYLPCGVGGGPGGITFGLKTVFGASVRCFFVEPTHAPCMLLGLATGLHDQISIEDFGLDGKTAADGLAVARPSGFVGKFLSPWIDGVITKDDATLFRLLKKLADAEGIQLEPSALAGVAGCAHLLHKIAEEKHKGSTEYLYNGTHVMWATGGNMVPNEEMESYYQTGQQLTS